VRSVIQALLARNLERQKAVYASSARTHERRIDVIMNLNRHLIEATRCFQVTTSGRQEAEPHVDEAIKIADGVLVQGLLLVPKPLRELYRSFDRLVSEGTMAYQLALNEMTNKAAKGPLWSEAVTISCQKLPAVLKEIDSVSRTALQSPF
jgi:hypothetical protein